MRERLDIPRSLQPGHSPDEQSSIDSAVALIAHLADVLGLADLGATRVLDVGCGAKFTQAFLERDVPIERYVGVDVNQQLIERLRKTVDDPRFVYHHLNIRNARYNPDGEPFPTDVRLPLAPEEHFDVICLFSVFTHLDPVDFRAMLRFVRRHASPSTHLVFSVFLDELSEGGFGLMDGLTRTLGMTAGQIDRYEDLNPRKPLHWPMYSRSYAIELVDETGWQAERIFEPTPVVQHHLLCIPRQNA